MKAALYISWFLRIRATGPEIAGKIEVIHHRKT